MHRFSIVVPLLGARQWFDDTLASVLRYRPASSQIILVHDGTYDNPYGLEDEVEFVKTTKGAGLIEHFNHGRQSATGELTAFVRPGIQFDEGWDKSLETVFENQQVASVTPIIVTPAHPNRVVAAGVKLGSGFRRQIVGRGKKVNSRAIDQVSPLGPISWAAFYRSSILEQIGGFDESLDSHYLDADIALSLKTIGYQSVCCHACVLKVDEPSLITDELVLPHGKSSQRSNLRHVASLKSKPSIAQSLLVIAKEIAASPFASWRLKHAAQRLGAWRKAKVDRDVAEQLSTLAKERKRLEAIGLRVHDSSNEVELDSAGRRAA